MNIKNLLPYLHGVIFSLGASFSIYVSMQDASIFSPPVAIWRPTIAILCLYAFSAVILYAIFRDHETSGLVSTVLILGLAYLWVLFIFVLIGAIITWLLLSVVEKKITATQLHISLITIGAVCLLYFGGSFAAFIFNNPWNKTKNLTTPLSIHPVEASKTSPDIYYIILDGYGGADMLQSLHGFDNSQFIKELEKRGFVIPKESKANYPRTILSLSSSLNMQYLDDVSLKMDNSYLWWPVTGSVADNHVMSTLKDMGYKTVNASSGWEVTSLKGVDYYEQAYPVFLNKFEELYFQSTNFSLFGFLNEFGVSTPSYNTHRNTILFQFNVLEKAPDLPSQKFVFIHLITPHAPFVFDAGGNSLTPDYPFTLADSPKYFSSPSAYRDAYISQLTFINKKVLQAVDNILLNSKTPPIIILQGDHGPGVFFDYNSSEGSCLYERYSILNAYYLPGISQEIPEDITPVNTFRFIFNEYFQADQSLLPNKYFFAASSTMYQFEDVSDKVNTPCVIN